MYVTVNDIELDGVARPFEVFVNSKNLEHYAWVVALTRMISAVFRRGGEVAFVAEELKQVFDPRGGQWTQRPLCRITGRRDRRRYRTAHDRHRLSDRSRTDRRRRTAESHRAPSPQPPSDRSARNAANPAWCARLGASAASTAAGRNAAERQKAA